MSLGTNLRFLRKKKKLSQTELAGIVGITERTIYNYENGLKVPKNSTLSLLADALGVTSDFLANSDAESEYTLKKNSSIDISVKSSALSDDLAFKAPAEILEQATAMFAGGELSQEAKDEFFESITQAYFLAKRKAKFSNG